MKLSDYKGGEAIDLLADLLTPIVNIYQDETFRDALDEKKSNLEIVQLLLKSHKEDVLYMMALIDQEDPATYEPSIFGLPMKLLEIMQMPEVSMLFTLRGQKIESENSGSATESIEEPAEVTSS